MNNAEVASMPKKKLSMETFPQKIICSALVLFVIHQCSARFPEAEGGSFVRIEAETPFAIATEEKDIAFVHLRRWGLGSQRQFAELAGELAECRCPKSQTSLSTPVLDPPRQSGSPDVPSSLWK